MANASNLNLPQLSHDGLAKRVATVEAYQESLVHNQKDMEDDDRLVLGTLTGPTTKSDSVTCSGEMIIVNGTEGHYTYEFDLPADDKADNDVSCYLEITYASGDPRPLVLTLNDTLLEGMNFCDDSTGGYGPEHYVQQRYGPFNLIGGKKNTLHVTTNRYWFPHVHKIRILDAVVMDQLLVGTGPEGINRSLGNRLPSTTISNRSSNRTWIVPPSQPFKNQEFATILLDGFCSWEGTQEANPNFVPDPNFYNAINCDGLWVCASKQCSLRVLHRACELVCRYVPIEIRNACLKWRAPISRPPGPFRLIILDNKTNQCAGDCPDFPNTWGGRNSTNNPACFTSAEDLDWSYSTKADDDSPEESETPHGELTVHELMHGIDMVIRQQIDPYFMQRVEDVWQANRNTYKKAYAYSDRHEYLAEISTLFVGCRSYNFKRGCSGCSAAPSGCCSYAPHALLPPGPGAVPFCKKSDLRINDPDGYDLLKTFLIEIHDPDDDTYWWQND